MKPILIILGVLVFGAALAGLGYFVIFPYFFPAETPAPILTPTQKSPNAVDLTPAAAPAPATAPRIHQSLLKIPAATQTQSFVSLLNLNNLRQILTTESSLKPSGTDVLKELLLSDANGQISFSDTLPLFIPELAAGELSNIFENDFTALIYFDANGAWPAWVAKLKTGVAVANAKNLISRLETSAGLMNLFIANPGAPTGTFKTGQVGSVQTRYLPFPQKGASLNYAFVGDKLIISASFNGLKRILNSL